MIHTRASHRGGRGGKEPGRGHFWLNRRGERLGLRESALRQGVLMFCIMAGVGFAGHRIPARRVD